MSSKTGPLVLVTGISGFFAQFVVDSLLASPEQYRIRGTLRSLAKRDAVLARLPEQARARVEFVEVKATESSDLSEALRGVDLVAHTASPYQLDVHDVEAELLRPALEGTLNVLRYAKQQPSVKRIAITSSFAAVTDFNKGGPNRPGFTYTERDWNPEGWEDAVKFGGAGARAYSASKKIADKAAWDFVEQEKPQFVVSTFNPPMIYGPPIQPGIKDVSSLNTSAMAIYRLISRLDALPDDRLPLFCHARDVADAHVQWLAYPREPVPRHRYLLCGGAFYWKMACEHISQTRPELADRLPKGWKDAQDKDPESALSKLDTTPAQQELGINFRDWKTTLDETLDGLLALEKSWK